MNLTESGFGAELAGVDLARLDEATRSRLLTVFHDSGGLVLVRSQSHLSPEDFLRFAALFGELESNEKYDPDFLLPGYPAILRIGNLKEGGRYRSLFVEADPPPLLWHSDDSFRHPQPLGSCLLCLETPSRGGETGFAGMTAAYEALDPGTKAAIEGLTAVHAYEYLNEYLRQRNPHRPPFDEAMRRKFPPLRRPLVAEHPVTQQKSLYLPRCHIEAVEGMSREQGDLLLTRLLEHATRPEFVYMHRWAPGDVLVWDNRSTLHAPSPFDAGRYRRLLYRATVTGEQIVGF